MQVPTPPHFDWLKTAYKILYLDIHLTVIYPLCVQVSVSCTCEGSSVELVGWLGGLSFSGYVAQLVTCLVTEACLTADPGVASSIPAWSQTNCNHLFSPNLIKVALASIQNE